MSDEREFFAQRTTLLALMDDAGVDCVDWPHSLVQGYGVVYMPGGQRRCNMLACEAMHGPRPTYQHEAAHSCGNAKCVNPHHLRWATPRENAADRVLHGTNSNGSRNGQAKLTEQQVLDIRRRVAAGEVRRHLAFEYGVHPPAITRIVNGQRWTHIPNNQARSNEQ